MMAFQLNFKFNGECPKHFVEIFTFSTISVSYPVEILVPMYFNARNNDWYE